jgi:ABC-type Fe3+ transport system permease subunit
MPLRRVLRALALTVMTGLLVTLPQAAHAASRVLAQKEVPPPYDELQAARPWTYLMGWAFVVLAVLVVIATALGYAVKGREFKANQRRGGSK